MDAIEEIRMDLKDREEQEDRELARASEPVRLSNLTKIAEEELS